MSLSKVKSVFSRLQPHGRRAFSSSASAAPPAVSNRSTPIAATGAMRTFIRLPQQPDPAVIQQNSLEQHVWKMMSQNESSKDHAALPVVPGREEANSKQFWSLEAAFADDDELCLNTPEKSTQTGLTTALIPRSALAVRATEAARSSKYGGDTYAPLLMQVAQSDPAILSAILKPAPIPGVEYDIQLLCEERDVEYTDILENETVGDLTEILFDKNRKWSKSRRQKTGCPNTKWRRKAARKAGFCH